MQLEHVPSDFDLRSIARIVWHRKLSIVLCLILCVGIQMFFSLRETPKYTASSQILVTPSSDLYNPNQATADPVRALLNESAIITSVQIRKAVAEETGEKLQVSASPSDKSDTVKLTASGSNASKVARTVNLYTSAYAKIRQRIVSNSSVESAASLGKGIAALQKKLDSLNTGEADLRAELGNATGNQALQATLANNLLKLETQNQSQRDSLNTSIGQLQAQQQTLSILNLVNAAQNTNSSITILTYAQVPSSPVSPKPLRDAMVAAMAGLLLGIALAYTREQTEDHVRGRLDLEADFPNYPVLAAVPSFTGIESNEIITERKRTSPAAEGYRKLRTSLEFLSLTQRLGVVEITSPAAGEGKTTTAVNLAVAVAQSGQRVIVVCADFRIPKTHLYFGLPNEVGMTSVLLDRATLADAVKPTRVPGLYILPSGPIPPNPSELLDSERAHEVIDALSARFDLVIIDTPPILPVADPLVTATMADATIVVVRSRKSRRRQLRRAIETLTQLEIPLAGLVLNDETVDEAHAFGYGYGYYGKSYGQREVSEAIKKSESAKANGSSDFPTLVSPSPNARKRRSGQATIEGDPGRTEGSAGDPGSDRGSEV